MTTFIQKDNNTFWGQYADIEQHSVKITDPFIISLSRNMEPIKEEDEYNDYNEYKEDMEKNEYKEDMEKNEYMEDMEKNEYKEDMENNENCNYNKILYYQLCAVIFTIFTIFIF